MASDDQHQQQMTSLCCRINTLENDLQVINEEDCVRQWRRLRLNLDHWVKKNFKDAAKLGLLDYSAMLQLIGTTTAHSKGLVAGNNHQRWAILQAWIMKMLHGYIFIQYFPGLSQCDNEFFLSIDQLIFEQSGLNTWKHCKSGINTALDTLTKPSRTMIIEQLVAYVESELGEYATTAPDMRQQQLHNIIVLRRQLVFLSGSPFGRKILPEIDSAWSRNTSGLLLFEDVAIQVSGRHFYQGAYKDENEWMTLWSDLGWSSDSDEEAATRLLVPIGSSRRDGVVVIANGFDVGSVDLGFSTTDGRDWLDDNDLGVGHRLSDHALSDGCCVGTGVHVILVGFGCDWLVAAFVAVPVSFSRSDLWCLLGWPVWPRPLPMAAAASLGVGFKLTGPLLAEAEPEPELTPDASDNPGFAAESLPSALAELLNELDVCKHGIGVISSALQEDLCEKANRNESGWNILVHCQILDEAIGGLQMRNQLVGFAPCTTAKIIHKYLLGSLTPTMVDFCMYLDPEMDKAALDASERIREELPCKMIDHTDFYSLRGRPITVSIETKTPSGAKPAPAELQLGTWHAAQWNLLENIVTRAAGTFEDLPFLPAGIVNGHDWGFTATTRAGKKTIFWSEKRFGSTRDPQDVYKMIWGLQRLAKWSSEVYWPWYR
ncbi:uncharacterized protein N7511_011298 [Penicillium nucicola]|uniref:uncharacterized protein n=1 Tax=Penicillium nucicola TaxID=1850975 RepID=UPI0025453B85|nr:uncharacterized protein N7511_011298 [Penicillium nucicola]KAJ5742566.1 hypothetical protein N7511_011298 [Penicillium nucicola]